MKYFWSIKKILFTVFASAAFGALVGSSMPALLNFHSTSITIDQNSASTSFPNFTKLYSDQDPKVVAITSFIPNPLPIEHADKDAPYPGMEVGIGSGFIITSDGYIVTNAHVVGSKKSKLKVILSNGKKFDAKLIGMDPVADIAVIKISSNNLPTVSIGDPNKLKIGEWVAAIGKPFDLANTFTSGIVSAKDRDTPSSLLVPFIQTTVPINPGNSGGPLFNMNGAVVGINSQIFTNGGKGFLGISFSIPINYAMDIVTRLEKYGHIDHSRIGIQISYVPGVIAEKIPVDPEQSVRIEKIDPAGPAFGILKDGDVVLKVDGQKLNSPYDLSRIVISKDPGATIKLSIWRNGQFLDVSIKTSKIETDN